MGYTGLYYTKAQNFPLLNRGKLFNEPWLCSKTVKKSKDMINANFRREVQRRMQKGMGFHSISSKVYTGACFPIIL